MEIAIVLVGREPGSSPSGVWSARTARPSCSSRAGC